MHIDSESHRLSQRHRRQGPQSYRAMRQDTWGPLVGAINVIEIQESHGFGASLLTSINLIIFIHNTPKGLF